MELKGTSNFGNQLAYLRGIGFLILISTCYLFFRNIVLIATFDNHLGLKEGVFGNPTQLQELLFYSVFFAVGLLGSIMLLLKKPIGWYLSLIVVSSALLLCAFAVTISFFDVYEYNTIGYMLLLLSLVVIFIFMNVRSFMGSLSIERSFSTYLKVLTGVFALGITSLLYFMI